MRKRSEERMRMMGALREMRGVAKDMSMEIG
jgi:hypothetical protein